MQISQLHNICEKQTKTTTVNSTDWIDAQNAALWSVSILITNMVLTAVPLMTTGITLNESFHT